MNFQSIQYLVLSVYNAQNCFVDKVDILLFIDLLYIMKTKGHYPNFELRNTFMTDHRLFLCK